MMQLGIDFGTCNSCAVLNVNGKAMPVQESLHHRPVFPSSVYLTRQNKIVIGQAAENQRSLDPSRYRREFKRELGQKEPLLLGGQPFLPQELIAQVLLGIKEQASTLVRTSVPFEQALDTVVITIPATYGSYRRELMQWAAERAGFKQVKLLEEPVAAAVYYAQEQAGRSLVEGEIVLVYDLGGGTFDAALIQKSGSYYQLLSQPVGDQQCGGIDFDRAIYRDFKQRCSEDLRALLEIDRKDIEAIRTQLILHDWCREFKHQLSVVEEHNQLIPLSATQVYSLNRSDFEQMIEPFINKTCDLCDQLVKDAELSWQRISHILLVGGSCRIPCIRQTLEKRFSCSVWQVDQPELAVALGAAIVSTQSSSVHSPESPVAKPPLDAPPDQRPIETVIQKLKPALVRLRDRERVGTGFVISNLGYILTCNHVLSEDRVKVEFIHGEVKQGQVVGRCPAHDLALVKVEISLNTILTFADPITLGEGQAVFALGYPLNLDLTVSRGIISNRNLTRDGTTYIQTDVSINPGNSGGPIVNQSGQVIGVAQGGIIQAQGLGFAIALRHILAFAAQMRIVVSVSSSIKIV